MCPTGSLFPILVRRQTRPHWTEELPEVLDLVPVERRRATLPYDYSIDELRGSEGENLLMEGPCQREYDVGDCFIGSR
jgi:hypothetical protein